jgi:hypothetical protein
MLARRLVVLELDASFYSVGGAVIHQVFSRTLASARPKGMFAPDAPALAAVSELGLAEGWPPGWLEAAVRDVIRSSSGGATGFLELAGLEVLAPPPAYVLAVKLASADTPGAGGPEHDLRYLLRSLNLRSADAALAAVTPYLAERQLPSTTRARLAALLEG